MEALGINPSGLITQIVSFIILFGILYSLLYKPLLKMIDQRAARIKEGLDQADSAREEAAHSRADMADQVAKARAEGQQMMAQARGIAQRFREEELEKAKQEIDAERARAQANIQKEKDAAIEELRRKFAGLVISAAERVVEKSLDEPTHNSLINSVFEKSSGIPKDRSVNNFDIVFVTKSLQCLGENIIQSRYNPTTN